MKTLFDRVDYFFDTLLGEKGYRFFVSMGRYSISLLSVALLAIGITYFFVQGSPWALPIHNHAQSEQIEQWRPGLEEFAGALFIASTASQTEKRVS